MREILICSVPSTGAEIVRLEQSGINFNSSENLSSQLKIHNRETERPSRAFTDVACREFSILITIEQSSPPHPTRSHSLHANVQLIILIDSLVIDANRNWKMERIKVERNMKAN